uniref:Uncharacterized protein n=1 Tax=Panagrolaimus sp. ES5 TaxID=591445 RepID=A0AC34FH28_9BILA
MSDAQKRPLRLRDARHAAEECLEHSFQLATFRKTTRNAANLTTIIDSNLRVERSTARLEESTNRVEQKLDNVNARIENKIEQLTQVLLQQLPQVNQQYDSGQLENRQPNNG